MLFHEINCNLIEWPRFYCETDYECGSKYKAWEEPDMISRKNPFYGKNENGEGRQND